MRSPVSFIVKPVGNRRYDNTKEIGGFEFVVSASEEDHRFSNRFAEVISTPLWYKGEISPGDILLVHHNVFKFYNDMKGRQKSGRSFFRDDVFMVDNEQFFMYKKDGKWIAHDRYCFVKPIKAVDMYLKKNFTEEPLMGQMVYPSKYLIEKGVNSGDHICFTPDSEYEFNVDGEKLFRMYESQITMKLN
jgi:hypothetical protein